EAIDLEGGNADADGDGLAILAAGTDALVELEIVAHHGDARENVGPIADEGGVLERRGDFAVFDEIRLTGGEDEFPVGNVDLAPTEINGVNAVLDGLEDVFGRVLAGEHVGVGHARHGDVFVTFAAAVAGVGHVHKAGGKLIGDVALENALLDEDGIVGR